MRACVWAYGRMGVQLSKLGNGKNGKLGSRAKCDSHLSIVSRRLCAFILLFFVISVVVVVVAFSLSPFRLFSFASVVVGCLSALTLMKSVAALVGKSTLLLLARPPPTVHSLNLCVPTLRSCCLPRLRFKLCVCCCFWALPFRVG